MSSSGGLVAPSVGATLSTGTIAIATGSVQPILAAPPAGSAWLTLEFQGPTGLLSGANGGPLTIRAFTSL